MIGLNWSYEVSYGGIINQSDETKKYVRPHIDSRFVTEKSQ